MCGFTTQTEVFFSNSFTQPENDSPFPILSFPTYTGAVFGSGGIQNENQKKIKKLLRFLNARTLKT